MPVISHVAYSKDLFEVNPDRLFVYGENADGFGRIEDPPLCRLAKNTHAIRVKRTGTDQDEGYFSDDDFAECSEMIIEDLRYPLSFVLRGGVVVLPAHGIGWGPDHMERRSPRLFSFLQDQLVAMCRLGGERLPASIPISVQMAASYQRIAKNHGALLIWTVFQPGREFINFFVARPFCSRALAPIRECLIDVNSESIRSRLPQGLVRMQRAHDEDDLRVVETWVP